MNPSTRRAFLARAAAGSVGAGMLVLGGSLGPHTAKAATHGPEDGTHLERAYLGTIRLVTPGIVTAHYHAYELLDRAGHLHAYEYILDGGIPEVRHLQGRRALHLGSRGAVGVAVEAFSAADGRYMRRLGDGGLVTHGVALDELRSLFGGEQGVLVDPIFGRRHPISLRPLASLPGETHLHVAFRFRPAHPEAPHPLRTGHHTLGAS